GGGRRRGARRPAGIPPPPGMPAGPGLLVQPAAPGRRAGAPVQRRRLFRGPVVPAARGRRFVHRQGVASMKLNLPVSQREVRVDPVTNILSTTDLKGRVTYVN